jgi:hypothetical protein
VLNTVEGLVSSLVLKVAAAVAEGREMVAETRTLPEVMLSIVTALEGTDAAAASCAMKDSRNVMLNAASKAAISKLGKVTMERTLVTRAVGDVVGERVVGERVVGEAVGELVVGGAVVAAASTVEVDVTSPDMEMRKQI